MINKAQLTTDIKTLMDATKVAIGQQDAIDNFASVLADKIADAIKRGIDTATVTKNLTSATGGVVTGTITLTATK
jgi:ribosomal protein S3